jgi:hypothetical protein
MIACDLSNTDSALPVIKQTTDEWFCQLGGQELGPMSFDELINYVENEQLSADDQVKLGNDGKWRPVGSIGRLVAVMPYKAVEKSIVPTPPKPKTPPVEHQVIDDDEEEDEDDDLSDLVMEMDAPPEPAPIVQQQSTAVTQAAYQAAYEQAKAKIAESMMAQAEQAYRQAEEQAKAQVAWATGPKADRHWWGWASGVEFGPVEFQQVLGLAKSGQLKPNDMIRNGQFAQFAPAANVPGLFNAVGILARAAEVLALAKSQADAAVKLAMPLENISPSVSLVESAPPVSKPRRAGPSPRKPAKSDPLADIEDLLAETDPAPASRLTARRSVEPARQSPAPPPEPRPVEPEPVEPRPPEPRPWASPAPATSNWASSSSATPVSRPTAPIRKPARSSGPSMLSGLLDQLKEPKSIGAVAAIALLALFFGWGYLPKSRAADIRHYNTLKEALAEVKKARQNPAELVALKPKLTKVGKEIAESLKKLASRDDPAKQCLLWAARDELPRMFEGTPDSQALAEKSFATRLQEAAYELGLEKRPAIAAVQGAPFPDE